MSMLRLEARPGSAANTPMPPVMPSEMRSVRRTVASTVASELTAVDRRDAADHRRRQCRAARRYRGRSPARPAPAAGWCPGRGSRCCSCSLDDADRPSTADHRGDADRHADGRQTGTQTAGAQPERADAQRGRRSAAATGRAGPRVGCRRRRRRRRSDRWRSCGHSVLVGGDDSPSSIEIRRGSELASSRSWVMITMVRPSACSSRRRSITEAPERESRLPVGSSARTIDGRLTMARAMATR